MRHYHRHRKNINHIVKTLFYFFARLLVVLFFIPEKYNVQSNHYEHSGYYIA